MNKINWKSWKATCQSYWRSWWPKIKDLLKCLPCKVGSYLWSAFLAFCFASTTACVCEPIRGDVFLIAWVLAWVVLRVIHYFEIRSKKYFAKVTAVSYFQSPFVFITSGIIACYLLGRDIASDGDSIWTDVGLIVMGALWMLCFLVDIFHVIRRNYQQAQLAIATLEEITNGLTDENTHHLQITGQQSDGLEKVAFWERVDNAPEDDVAEETEQDD